MDVWDASKENFQPLRQGRDPKAMENARPLNSKDGSEPALELERQRHIQAIEQYKGDDPIVPWQQYIAWVLASYPSGADRAALPVLEWCTRELASHPRYARDVRYLRVWVQYANFLRDPLDVFLFLRDRDIGQDHALFFEAFSAFLERQGAHTRAREVYDEGIRRRAQPLARLRKRRDEFEQRMERRRLRQAEAGAPPEPEPVRFALLEIQARAMRLRGIGAGALGERGPGSGVAGTATGLAGGPGASAAAAAVAAAAGSGQQHLEVFMDDEFAGGGGGARGPAPLPRAGAGAFPARLPTAAEGSKENTRRATQWSGQALPAPLPGAAVGPAPALDVYMDDDLPGASRGPAESDGATRRPMGATLRQRLDASAAAFEELQKDPLRFFHEPPPPSPGRAGPSSPGAAPAEGAAPAAPISPRAGPVKAADALRGYDPSLLVEPGTGAERCFEEARLAAWMARRGAVPREGSGAAWRGEARGSGEGAADVSMASEGGAEADAVAAAVGDVTVNTRAAMALIDGAFGGGGAAAAMGDVTVNTRAAMALIDGAFGGPSGARASPSACAGSAPPSPALGAMGTGGPAQAEELGLYEDTVFRQGARAEGDAGDFSLDIREDTCFIRTDGPAAAAGAGQGTRPQATPAPPISEDKENAPVLAAAGSAGAGPSTGGGSPSSPGAGALDPEAENRAPQSAGGEPYDERGRALPPRALGDPGVEACVLRPLDEARAAALGVRVGLTYDDEPRGGAGAAVGAPAAPPPPASTATPVVPRTLRATAPTPGLPRTPAMAPRAAASPGSGPGSGGSASSGSVARGSGARTPPAPSPDAALRAPASPMRDPFEVAPDARGAAAIPGPASPRIVEAFSQGLLRELLAGAGAAADGVTAVELGADEAREATEAVREASEGGMGTFAIAGVDVALEPGPVRGTLTATVMGGAGDGEPRVAEVASREEALWGWHLSGAVQRRCGPGSSRHVPSPALVVLCGPSAIVLHPRDDTTTLADVLQAHAARGRPVGEALALRYAAQSLRCLACLHRAGVVHGDLSPSALVVATDSAGDGPDLQVSGLGRACDMRALPPGSLLRGCGAAGPAFQCPEMAGSLAWSHGADNHAVAAIVHLLATGAAPPPHSRALLPPAPPPGRALWADWQFAAVGLAGLDPCRACPGDLEAMAAAMEARLATAGLAEALHADVMRQNVIMHGGA